MIKTTKNNLLIKDSIIIDGTGKPFFQGCQISSNLGRDRMYTVKRQNCV
jgi:hypothetical protein